MATHLKQLMVSLRYFRSLLGSSDFNCVNSDQIVFIQASRRSRIIGTVNIMISPFHVSIQIIYEYNIVILTK